jgi:hypothetical protein
MSSSNPYVQFFINSRSTPDEVKKQLRAINVPENYILEAYNEFKKIAGSKKYLSPPPMLINHEKKDEVWYPGADNIPDAKFWPALRIFLQNNKKWPNSAVESIHNASDKIVSLLESPWASRIKTRGLVVGYVQSGKTANFTAVIAKAADVGYRFFIILSGTKKSLRQQTQQRLERELVFLNDEIWFTPTTNNDFQPIGNANYFLAEKKYDKVLFVIKKNSTVLRKMITWLKSASPDALRKCPFLIIDDEADEASVNTAKGQALKNAEDTDRTSINKHLVDLLKLLPKAAYIGYTATPFANIFIDPRSENDLYPRDFIVALPKPLGHFGTEEIFGRARLVDDNTDEEFMGLDMIREIPDDEVELLRPKGNDHNFVPEITPSLANALNYFWLACAARKARGTENEFSTMFIHTTQLVEVHNSTRLQIANYQKRLIRELKGKFSKSLVDRLIIQWEEEQHRVCSKDFNEQPIKFQSLEKFLLKVIEDTYIVADNFKSDYRLSYENEPKIQIAVGGNTLSRGLTLEGLIVSFFVRAAGAYDTLLQMGRWFGYRPGYADLPRIWMTEELREQFFDLATIEAEMRRNISNYELQEITPEQYGLKIRTHPDLNITAPLKMQHIVNAQVSFEEERVQTVIFDHKNKDLLQKNVKNASKLITNITNAGYCPINQNGHHLFTNIPAHFILDFFDNYSFHPNNRALQANLLNGYIKDQIQYGLLKEWNIVIRGVTGNGKTPRGEITLGPLKAPLLERAKRRGLKEHAHIGVLMSKNDTGLDLPISKEELQNLSEKEIKDRRKKIFDGIGLLVIYPISKDSIPGKGAKGKENLDASENIIALGIVFPTASKNSRGTQNYVWVNPNYLKPEELDEEEDENL